jgi:hypothetical protein
MVERLERELCNSLGCWMCTARFRRPADERLFAHNNRIRAEFNHFPDDKTFPTPGRGLIPVLLAAIKLSRLALLQRQAYDTIPCQSNARLKLRYTVKMLQSLRHVINYIDGVGKTQLFRKF